ncbi:MAG: YhjD/YihY/BrkB family envelope integrity protein, partial [Lawsonibacter sp.]
MLKKILSLPPISFGLEVADTYGRTGASRSAAALSYFLIMTLFPLLMCVNYFIGLFHLNLEQVLQALDQLLPAGALSVMEDYLAYVAGIHSPALLWASLFTILVSASAGLRTLFLTMDELYQVQRDNGFGRMILSVILSALFLLTIYLSVVVIFTGDWFFWLLEEHLPRRLTELLPLESLSGLWQWMRYLLLFCAVLLLVLAL